MEIEKKEPSITDNIKGFVKKIEKKGVDYFQSREKDIYTRFVRRMLVFLLAACFVGALILLAVLMVSALAKPLTKVPSVKGMDIIEASLEIEASGLTVEVESKYDPAIDRYLVIEQFPKQGVTVRQGRNVKLLVSMGKDIYKAPSVTGMSKEDAETLLKKLNISYEIDVIQSDDFPLNTVTSQDIQAGTEVDRSVKMKLLVNSDVRKGEYKITDFTRQPLDIVAQQLIGGSILPIIDKVIAKTKDDDGMVLSQSISAGTVIPKNSDIHLQVGVWGNDDLEKQKYNYYIFSYAISSPSQSSDDMLSDTKSSAGMSGNMANVRIIVNDEKNQKTEIFNKQVIFGETIIVTFKTYGKSKLSLLVNNSFVKEVSYE